MFFMHCVTLLQKNLRTTLRQYVAVLLYIMLWSEQICVRGIVMKSNKVCCLISLCSCFVIKLKFVFPSTFTNGGCGKGEVLWYGRTGRFFTDVRYIVGKTTTSSVSAT
jgi:hypothetical protein